MSITRAAVREIRQWDPRVAGIVSNADDARLGWSSWAGVAVNEMRALQQTTVWACIRLISDTISQLPIGTFERPDGFPVPVPPARVIEEPHPDLDRVDWFGQMFVSGTLRGNAYGVATNRDRMGFPTTVLPLHPDEVTARLIAGRLEYFIGGSSKPEPREDILHMRGLMLPGKRLGMDPIRYARETIGTALGAEEYGARYFSESSSPPGVLQSKEPVGEPDAKRYQKMWMDSHGQRSRKPAVLGGGLEWKPLSVQPEESQFLQTIQAKRSEIAGFFGCPPHLVGDITKSTSWGSGMEEQNLMWIAHGLGIWISRMERAVSRFMLPKGQYARFNVSGLLRGRLLQQAQAFVMARNGGWLNIDEIRALLELGPLPDGKGQDYLQALNYGVIPAGGGEAIPPESPAPDAAGLPA